MPNVQTKEWQMNAFEKILNVLAKNLGYTLVLVAAIILFGVFSGGLLAGLITAGSALVAYACIEMLYKEYRGIGTTTPKTTTKKTRK